MGHKIAVFRIINTQILQQGISYSSGSRDLSFLFLMGGLAATLAGAVWSWCSFIIHLSLSTVSRILEYVLASELKYL